METRLLGISVQIMVLAIIISVVLLILGMGVLVLISASTVELFSRWNSNLRNDSDPRERDDHKAGNGFSPDDLEKLPCYDYAVKDSKDQDSSAECAVCLETFRDSQRCRLLPACKHSFHVECVDSWLLKNSICPLCRTVCAEHLVGKDAEP